LRVKPQFYGFGAVFALIDRQILHSAGKQFTPWPYMRRAALLQTLDFTVRETP
jgi:hypothetical protein